MTEEKLFDIEYWLPLKGGEYHCTIAVGVTQSYVDKIKDQYEKDFAKWRSSPSVWRLPFFHTIKVIDHQFMSKDLCFIKIDKYNEDKEKAEGKGYEKGMKEMARSISPYITNTQRLNDFNKNFKQYLND